MHRLLVLVSLLLLASIHIACDDDGKNPEALSASPDPIFRDAGFYGVNSGPSEILHMGLAWLDEQADPLHGMVFETRVKVTATSSGNATAGMTLLADPRTGGRYNLGIFPNEDSWQLYESATGVYLATEYEPGSFELDTWYTLRAVVSGDRIHVFINGVRKSPPEGYSHTGITGRVALRVRHADASFDDVLLADGRGDEPLIAEAFDGEPRELVGDRDDLWSVGQDADGNGTYRGNVLIGRESLMDEGISPDHKKHFELLDNAGAAYIRTECSWSDVQPEGPGDYYWDYLDAMAISAHEHDMKLVLRIVYAPNWAVAPEHRGDFAYYAYPPVNLADFDRFVRQAVSRYMPGGELAREQEWDEDFGVLEYEVGHEYNIGTVFKSNGELFFAGWLGDLDQYVDLLKTGHDAIKEECPQCLVMNGATTDDMPPGYATSRTDPDGWRQYLWQGVEDLYENIQNRHPGDPNAADHYFDILNIHTYEWFMLSGQGQFPDRYRNYAFPDPQWYRDRLGNVIEVMRRFGDADKKIWLTETSYASNDNGDAFAGHLGEQGQAEALWMIYEEASRFPEVEKVFWWYSFDLISKVGLIRDDLTAKPSYEVFSLLTGKATR